MKKNLQEQRNDSYDARFGESLGGSEYEDLLIALDFYDEFQQETGKALHDYVTEHCQKNQVVKVLEAGPGTGITTLELLKADPRVRVTSVDNEPKMLKAVKERFAKLDELADRVDFILADILAYLEACEDNSLDAFASVYTLHNFNPNFRKKVISLIAKKLKSGAIFINGDKYAREKKFHKQDFADEIQHYGKFAHTADEAEIAGNIARAAHLRKIQAEWIHHAHEDEINRITVEEQNELFEQLGFKDIRWGKRFGLVTTVTAVKK